LLIEYNRAASKSNFRQPCLYVFTPSIMEDYLIANIVSEAAYVKLYILKAIFLKQYIAIFL
jgi:hypothetical protein